MHQRGADTLEVCHMHVNQACAQGQPSMQHHLGPA